MGLEPKPPALQDLPVSCWGRGVPGVTVPGEWRGSWGGAGDRAGLVLEWKEMSWQGGTMFGEGPLSVPWVGSLGSGSVRVTGRLAWDSG